MNQTSRVKKSYSFMSQIRERLLRLDERACVRQSRSIVESLEARLLFSADLFAAGLSAPQIEATSNASPAVLAQANIPQATQSPADHLSAQQNIELVVIDEKVQDPATLLADIQRQSEAGRRLSVLHVSSFEDGTAAITRALAEITENGSQVTAIHIVSHGSDGEFVIGNQTINEAAVRLNPEQFSAWSLGLTNDADLLIYGCDFASTSRGQQLAQNLAAITGADVAGNSSTTGNQALGGDWSLDVQVGAIESTTAISDHAQSKWRHVLSINLTADPSQANESSAGNQSTGPALYSQNITSESTGGNKIAVDANGNYAVVWTENQAIKIRFFAQDGSARTATQTIVLSNPADLPGPPAIAMNSAGKTVVVWSEDLVVTTAIVGIQFEADGTPSTQSPFALAFDSFVTRPAVAINDLGLIAVAWESANATTGVDIKSQVFNADFTGLSNEVTLNQALMANQIRPAIAIRGDLVAVTWQDTINGSNRIALRSFNINAGLPIYSDEANANLNLGLSDYGAPDVAITTNNNIVVAWQARVDGHVNTFFTMFPPDIANPRIVSDVLINTEVGQNHSLPKIAALQNGEFLIAQQSFGHGSEVNAWGVFVRHFGDSGQNLSGNLESSLSFSAIDPIFNLGNQTAPNIASKNGKIVAAWTSDQNGNLDVFSRQFQTTTENLLVVDTVSDQVDGDTSTFEALIAFRGSDNRISLREALIAANNTPNTTGVDRIVFNIPQTNGGHAILLGSSLPLISDTVYIDGGYQYSFDGGRVSVINNSVLNNPTFHFFGSPVGGNDSSGSYLSGLTIESLAGTSILVESSGVSITNNQVHSDSGTAIQINGSNSLNTTNNAILLNNLSGSFGFGIEVVDAGATQIVDNNLYANVAGGILLSSTGTNTATTNNTLFNNVIGYSPVGIVLSGSGTSGNYIRNNYIGVNRLSAEVGNTGVGLLIHEGASANYIGGTSLGEGNTIAHNGGVGVQIDMSGSVAAIDNQILRNSIYSNQGAGISVLTLAEIPTPIINAVSNYAGSTNVRGYLASAPNTHYRIEIFSNPPGMLGDFTQGATFLTAINVLTDSAGVALISANLLDELAPGYTVTTTATITNANYNSYGETSVFSTPTSVGIQVYQPENTNFSRDISDYTRNPSQPNLTYTLANVPDSQYFQLTPDGTLSFAVPANYESMLTDPNGGDYSWWAGVIISDGLQYSEYVTHIFHITDANDPPAITRGASQSVEPGALVAFTGSNAISIADQAEGLAAVETVMRLTISAEIASAPGQPTGTVNINGLSSSTVTIDGTLVDLNGFLAGMTFLADPADIRTVRLFIKIEDNGSGILGAPNLSDSQWQDIDIVAVSIPPAISAVPTSLVFLENAAPLAIFGNAILTNFDGPDLYGLTIRYPVNLPSGSTLTFPNPQGLAGLVINRDFLNGIYSVSGQASIATYQNIIRGLTYTNASNSPALASLVFSADVSSETLTSAQVQTSLTVQPVNDAPQISLGGVTVYNIGFNGELSFGDNIAQALSLTDPDQGPGTATYSLTISIPASPTAARFTVNAAAMQVLIDSGLGYNFDSNVATTVLLSGSSAQIQQAARLITFRPDVGQSGPNTINFYLSDNGNSGAGGPLATLATLTVNTAANSAPVISGLTTNKLFIENSAVIYPLAGIDINDFEQTTLSGATVILNSGFDFTQDLRPVFVNLPGQIQASWLGNVLTLSGTFPIASYEAALASITYQNISENPSSTPREFTVSVSDGFATSNTVSVNVTPVPVNDATIISLPPSAQVPFGQTILLNNRDGNLFLLDIDAGTDAFEMTLTVNDGLISLSNTAGVIVVGSNNAGDVEIKMRGTIATLNFALQNHIQFTPATGFAGATLTATIEAIDQGSGTTIPGALTQANLNLIALAAIPIDIHEGSNKVSFAENGSPVRILPLATLSGGNTGYVQTIEILFTQGFQAGIDKLEVTKLESGMQAVWDDVIGKLTISGIGTMSEFNTALQSVVFFNESENPNGDVREVSLLAFDGLQFSVPLSTSIIVEPINDAPLLVVPTNIKTTEDNAVLLALGNGLTVADVDSNQLSLSFVVNTGTLTWVGAGSTPSRIQSPSNQEVLLVGTAAEINLWASQFQFIAPANFSGVAQIQWNLSDEQGAIKNDLTSLDISAVNDAPIWLGSTNLSLTQGALVKLTSINSSVTDIEDQSTLLTYFITAQPTQGVLMFNGAALQFGAVFTQDDINKGAISYKHNNSAQVADAFSFFVKDSSGGQTPIQTMTLAINPIPTLIVASNGAGSSASGSPSTTVTPSTIDTSIANVKSTGADDADTSTAAAFAAIATSAGNSGAKAVSKAGSSNSGNTNNSSSGESSSSASSIYSGAARANDLLAASSIKPAPTTLANEQKSEEIRTDATAIAGQLRTRSQSENIEYAAIIRTSLNSQQFNEDLQRNRASNERSIQLDKNVIASTTAVSTTLSVGYVIWLVRGGALLSSLLASIPAWRAVDPLPVLGTMAETEEDQDDDSLDAMIEKAKAKRENPIPPNLSPTAILQPQS
jgi:Domain of unknown function (DUF4347)/Cadherin-like/Right handed beta helix region